MISWVRRKSFTDFLDKPIGMKSRKHISRWFRKISKRFELNFQASIARFSAFMQSVALTAVLLN